MKFLLIAIFLTACICHLAASEAARSKRAVSRGKCPENTTQEQCEAYAKQEAAGNKNTCVRYGVSNGEIVWHSCGVRVCIDESGNKYRAKENDLTKSYPDCCPKCHRKAAN